MMFTSLHNIFVAIFLVVQLQIHTFYWIISGPVLHYTDVYRSLRLGACLQSSIVVIIIACICGRHFQHL